MKYKRVMTIAGSDSGGGAGIQADIKAISACGCYASSAITAVTAQNTVGVRAVEGLPVSLIRAQMVAVLDDIGTDCVKIGMLHSGEVVKTVASTLKEYGISDIVLDPVMVAKSGDRLIEEEAIGVLKTVLLPAARVITPNIPEAAILLGQPIRTQEDMPDAARCLGETNGVSVLLKAGHMSDIRLRDIFYNRESGRLHTFVSERVLTGNTHGTGCTLSASLAAMLARGLPLDEAVPSALEYIHGAIAAGSRYETGHGHGPVCHFYRWMKP